MSLPRRQWFQPGDSIAREVISADIQRYLGPDATVRPGVGTGEYEGLDGYWITAYKTLTSSQVQDLKQDSERWLSERRQGGRESYNQSYTHAQRQQHGPSEPVRHAEYAAPSQPTYSHYPSQDQQQYTYQQPQSAYSYTTQSYPQQPRTAGYSYPPQAPAADPRYAQPTDPRYYPQSSSSAPPTGQYAPPQPSSTHSYHQDSSRASNYPPQQAYSQASYPQGYAQQYQYQYQQPPSSSSRGTRR